MIIDCAHYLDGARHESGPIDIAAAAAHVEREGGFVWLTLEEPTAGEMADAERAFGLHELAVEDARCAHQRAKLEDYEGASWFAVLKSARYDEREEQVHFGEIHLFIGARYLIAVQHEANGELREARERIEARPDLLSQGVVAAVWSILDTVVDGYEPVASGIEDDIDEVEEQVFSDQGDEPTQRIHALKREVLQFNRAVQPLLGPLTALERGSIAPVGDEMARYFRDVADHARRVYEQNQAQRELLTSVLEANLVQVSLRQGAIVRSISAWAAIIAVPTFIASVYGMNFDHMPELHTEYGYPMALAVMGIAVLFLHRYFRRIDWI